MEFRPKQQLREYQRDALKYGLNRDNSVCVLPTGTGKTLVGLAWCCTLLNQKKARRILVIEPTRYLVEQVFRDYLKNSNFNEDQVGMIYGIVSREERVGEWSNGLIVVSTSQTAFNDLDFLDFDAVIVDECHHTVGQHAFAKLMDAYPFRYKLGLSATIPEEREQEIERRIGKIRRWPWKELKEKYPDTIPDWIGEVYDSELGGDEIHLLKMFEERRSALGKFSGLVGMGVRMFVRDGALALNETLRKGTMMSEIIGSEIREYSKSLRELHKIDQARAVLRDHDFEKAILFVDRRCVAEKLVEYFKEYNPVLLLGKLRSSHEEQRKAVEKAMDEDVKLIIATSAGEEGIDLPEADLLIVWSNVASPLRFIQRHGRIMRPSEKLKIATYIATPGTKEVYSPDYDSLLDGLIAAREAGLDIEGIDKELIKSRSYKQRVRALVKDEPLRYDEIAARLKQSESKVNKWLSTSVKEENEEYRLFYFYEFPVEEFRSSVLGGIKYLEKEGYGDLLSKRATVNFLSNLFKLVKNNRFYASVLYAEIVEEEYEKFFLSIESFNGFLNCTVSEKPAGETLASAWIIGAEKKEYLLQSGITLRTYSNLMTFLNDALIYIGQPLYLKFFERGKNCFVPPFTYHGIFTEKTLELTMKNAFYIANTFRTQINELKKLIFD
ncbi:MAG: DEAD/DEAH box helicase family protein [Candidatus Jordarchaeum sp.]|uniref:DEAD/DEAH box helicase family protein n=1 Tax=Candidatus Jordarchaeum sp. TaxID=2823881 RepID=UPI004049C265